VFEISVLFAPFSSCPDLEAAKRDAWKSCSRRKAQATLRQQRRVQRRAA
jgi:hypothetical protein